jgi:hypothetical protein
VNLDLLVVIDPSPNGPAARKYQRVHSIAIDHGEFKIEVERRACYELPHLKCMVLWHRPRLDLDHVCGARRFYLALRNGLCYSRVRQLMTRRIRPQIMSMVDEYRRYAAECLTLRASINDSRQCAVLLSMAIAWADLAETAEKNQKNDLAYETLTGRESGTPRTAQVIQHV